MNLQFKAAWELHLFFTKEKIPYVIIGGIAVQRWGEPRFTRDVDVTILISKEKEKQVLKKICTAFSPRISGALEFALKNRVCLVKSKEGCEIDISLGIPGYEEEVIQRAIEYELNAGKIIRICTAEDLIIHKAIAGRAQDCGDIEGIIIRQGSLLNCGYIQYWLKLFSELLENREVLERFEQPWRRLMQS